MEPPRALARLSLERRPELAPLARDTARAVAGVLEFTESEIADIELAVGEAVANALKYGDRTPVEVSFTHDEDRLVIEILGNTRGFTPPDPGLMPTTGAERGRGLAILATLMDVVKHVPVEGGVALRLEKRLAETPNKPAHIDVGG